MYIVLSFQSAETHVHTDSANTSFNILLRLRDRCSRPRVGPEDIQPCSGSAGWPDSSGASAALGTSGSSPPGARRPSQPRCP